MFNNSTIPKLNLIIGITGLYIQLNVMNPMIKSLEIKLDKLDKIDKIDK